MEELQGALEDVADAVDDAVPPSPQLPPLNTINDLIGGVLMLHERAQNDPEFRKTLQNYPEREGLRDSRTPFRGTDQDFEFLVNCLVESAEKEKEVEDLKKQLENERNFRRLSTPAAIPTTFSYTYSPIFNAPPPQSYMPFPMIPPKTEPIYDQNQQKQWNGYSAPLNAYMPMASYNGPSTSTAVPAPYYPNVFQPVQPPAMAAPMKFEPPSEEDLNIQDEMAYMDQQIGTMAAVHEEELLNLKLDHLVENKHWEDRIAQIKEDNEKLEEYCIDAELAKAEVEETLEKREERLRRQVELQSVKDWKLKEVMQKMEEKDKKILELEARLSSMESSTSCELEQLRAQLSKMVVDPTEKRKKPRVSECLPSTSQDGAAANGAADGRPEGWSQVDDSGDVWVYGEDA